MLTDNYLTTSTIYIIKFIEASGNTLPSLAGHAR